MVWIINILVIILMLIKVILIKVTGIMVNSNSYSDQKYLILIVNSIDII